MTTENPPSERTAPPRTDGGSPAAEFAMHFTATPRGARLARRLVSHRLAEWGYPCDSQVNETLTLIAAELAANAVRHGYVPGQDFHLGLAMTPGAVRIEVTDNRTARHPLLDAPVPDTGPDPELDAESGRGLFLVSQLADRWACTSRPGAPGKTVWAEAVLTGAP